MIVACIKWSSYDRDGDRDGAGDDLRFSGVSHADQAALEIALRLGEALGLEVLTISAGPVGCERALRDASACGAQHVLRLDMPSVSESRDVAAALAEAAGAAAVIVCGDHSIDRGSGSVPAFIAHHRQAAQALGLVSLDLPASTAGALRAVRRLDGGRREVLSVPLPCVVSVESSVASLRRASLRRALAAESATVPSRSITVAHRAEAGGSIASFRPRPRALSAPSGAALDRVRQLTDADTAPAHGETIDLEPRAAAERVLAALRDWGYLSPDPARPTRPRDER